MDLCDFSWLTKEHPQWVPERIIFLTMAGSHAYGTNLPTSDVDLRGICIPPKEYFLGFLNKVEDVEVKGDPDVVIYAIRKFIELAADCNPNIIELLFTDESDWIRTQWLSYSLFHSRFDQSPWGKLYRERHIFLSKAAQHRFSGYAFGQLKRIKSHRGWLLNPPKKHPEREDFGLRQEPTLERQQFGIIESRIRKLEDSLGGKGWTKDRVEERDEELVTTVVGQIDISPALIPLIIAERKYNAAMRNWTAYMKWKDERNPKRQELEAKYGYDTKHAMHLVRLLRMAVEILRDGKVLVKRPDAEELKEIRAGGWSFERLMDWAVDTEVYLDIVAQESKLPHAPNRNDINDLLVEIVEARNHA